VFVDSHAHLTSEQFDHDRDEVIRRAQDAGVGVIINPAINLDDSRRAIELAEQHKNVYACVGFHPHEARHATDAALEDIEELSRHPKVVAIGEIGLDFHYDSSPREVQAEVFRLQVGIAQRRMLPIVIHTRESNSEVFQIVEEAARATPLWGAREGTGGHAMTVRGVFHCFSGDAVFAQKVIEYGFLVSLPGIITFKNAGLATEVVREVSLGDLLLETDSPYLAPVPLRGKRNEPANIPLIAGKIAGLKSTTVDDVATATSGNVARLFRISM
jgi:TatD DNase family protein